MPIHISYRASNDWTSIFATLRAVFRWTFPIRSACWDIPKPFKITLRVAARFYKNAETICDRIIKNDKLQFINRYKKLTGHEILW